MLLDCIKLFTTFYVMLLCRDQCSVHLGSDCGHHDPPYTEEGKPDFEEWCGILWKDGTEMQGFYALKQLMVPIPRYAKALRPAVNTDIATAVFDGDGKVVITS